MNPSISRNRPARITILCSMVVLVLMGLTACKSTMDNPAQESQASEGQPSQVVEAMTPSAMPSETVAVDRSTPEEPLPAPTNASVNPLEPTPEPAGGIAYFQDNLSIADQLIVDLRDIDPAPEGQVYVGWLVAEDGSLVNTGVLQLKPDGEIHLEWTSPDGRNLLGDYYRFEVSLETDGNAVQPTGKKVLAGELSQAEITIARNLFVSNQGDPSTPRNLPFAPGMMSQIDVVVQHINNAKNAAAIGATSEMRNHLEHVINILEGTTGPRYHDYNNDGSAQNPGDGFGVISYARQIGVLGKDPVLEADVKKVEAQIMAIESQCIQILDNNDTNSIASLIDLGSILRTDIAHSLYLSAQEKIQIKIRPLP